MAAAQRTADEGPKEAGLFLSAKDAARLAQHHCASDPKRNGAVPTWPKTRRARVGGSILTLASAEASEEGAVEEKKEMAARLVAMRSTIFSRDSSVMGHIPVLPWSCRRSCT